MEQIQTEKFRLSNECYQNAEDGNVKSKPCVFF